MAKLVTSLFLLLAAFFYVEGILIKVPKQRLSGKLIRIPTLSSIIPNDPRCRGANGMFINPNNCKAYYTCKDGTGQDRVCPEGMTFHPLRHCTFVENPECNRNAKSHESSEPQQIKCRMDNEIFVHPKDCRKYVVCVDGVPDIRTCPENQWYQENVGCVEANECPQEKRVDVLCRRPNGIYADQSNCRKYIKCSNWIAEMKECPEGEAFYALRKVCKAKKEVKCKSNSLIDMTESHEFVSNY